MKYFLNRVSIAISLLFLSTILFSQDLQWLSTATNAKVNDIAVSSYGDYFAIGTFTGTVDFDPGPGKFILTSNGGSDIFVASYDWEGNLISAINIGGTANDEGLSIVPDNMSGFHITGSFKGTVDFNPDDQQQYLLSSQGGSDIFAATFTGINQFSNAASLGGPGNNAGTSITTAMNGDIFVGGYFSDSLRFSLYGEEFFSVYGGAGSFVIARFSFDMLEPIAHDLNPYGQSKINELVFDGVDAIYATGSFSGSLNLMNDQPDMNLISKGSTDIFIAKFFSFGELIWVNQIGNTGTDEGSNIILSNGGGIITSGVFSMNAIFDPNSGSNKLVSAGSTDIYVAGYDSNGNNLFAESIGGSQADFAAGIAMDYTNTLYIGGITSSSLTFSIYGEDYPLKSTGKNTSFVLKTVNGEVRRIFPAQKSGDVQLADIALDMSSELLMGGNYSGTCDLNPGLEKAQATASGFNNMFISSFLEFEMYLDAPIGNLCPQEPYAFIPNRKKTPGLEIKWQYDNKSGAWYDIKENAYYKIYGTDSLVVSPAETFDSYSYRFITKDNFGTDTLDFPVTISINPLTAVDLGNDTLIFPGEEVLIDAGVGYNSYLWNTGETTQSITTDSAGYYNVIITDANGCHNSDTMAVNITFLATVDTATNQIMVVWGRSLNPGSEKLNIYRISGSSRTLLKTIDFSSENRFYDELVDINNQAYTYDFELENNVSGDTKTIAQHQTIFCKTLSKASNNTTYIHWNAYKGLSFDTFYVYRGPSIDQMEIFAKVKNDPTKEKYFVLDEYHYDNMYYRVEIESALSVAVTGNKANNGPFSRSISNLEDNRLQASGIRLGESKDGLNIYPNPMIESCIIEFSNPTNQFYTLNVIDISGKVLLTKYNIDGESYLLNQEHLQPGYYIIELNGTNSIRSKLIIQ